jgi:hypothetical protein
MLSRDEIEQMLAAHRRYLETQWHQGHRANFASADLSGQDFSGLNLRGIKMDRAVLRGADFTGTQLQRATLIGVISEEARFDRADLSGARLSGANLVSASLENASYPVHQQATKLPRHRLAEVGLEHGYRVTCADTASHFPSPARPDIGIAALGCMSYGGGSQGNHAWSLGKEESRPFSPADNRDYRLPNQITKGEDRCRRGHRKGRPRRT